MFLYKAYKMSEKLTTIQVTDALRRDLKILVAQYGYKNYDELIKKLVEKGKGDLK